MLYNTIFSKLNLLLVILYLQNQKNYIEIQKGTIPLIISVPHGGILECENIPKRSHGILGTDGRTIEIAKILMKRIKFKFKKQNLEKVS